jgi:hypothetical protein
LGRKYFPRACAISTHLLPFSLCRRTSSRSSSALQISHRGSPPSRPLSSLPALIYFILTPTRTRDHLRLATFRTPQIPGSSSESLSCLVLGAAWDVRPICQFLP